MDKCDYKAFLLLGIKCLATKPPSNGRFTFPKLFGNKQPHFNILILRDLNNNFFYQGMLEIMAPENKTLTLREAMDIVHYYQAIRTIYYFCVVKNYEEFSLLPLGKKILNTTPPWSLDELINLNGEEINYYYSSINTFKDEFGTYSMENLEDLKNCTPLLARCVNDKNFRLASSYLYKSIKDLNIDICDWQKENYDKEYDEFASDSDRESAFINACKTIEAICGDFGNNPKTYGKKLENVGISPNKRWGVKKETLLSEVVRYLKLRDKLAAHGSGKKRRIKITEIFDFQTLARHILLFSKRTYNLRR